MSTKNYLCGKSIACFIAMSFREDVDAALVDYYAAMKRATTATDLNINLRRVDHIDGDYEISQKIMNEIDQADIVLADFTLNSPNVYFEVGYARGKGRPVIQTARKGTNLEFDIRNWRTVIYSNATELEEKLAIQLQEVLSRNLPSKVIQRSRPSNSRQSIGQHWRNISVFRVRKRGKIGR
jgi:nucleoside 2-deoxyribosyltransferase